MLQQTSIVEDLENSENGPNKQEGPMTQPQGGNRSSLLTRRPSDVFPPQRSLFSRPGTAPVLPSARLVTPSRRSRPWAPTLVCALLCFMDKPPGWGQWVFPAARCLTGVSRCGTRFRESVSVGIMPGHLPLGVNSYREVLAHPGHV